MPEVHEDMSYRNLINKAYIEPIKSVLAIDDQYQSLDNLLANLQRGTPLTANAELTRQIQTLEMVRGNNWLADMDNGQTDPGSTIFDRLHQCDLLLLDYHLDENNQDDPEKALNILSQLNQNHHFNLVIVYTAASNLNKVRSEIFTKLSSSKNELFSKPTQGVEQLLEQWSDDGESYQDEMLESISRSDLETVLSTPSIIDEANEFTAIFSPVDLILSSANENLSTVQKQQLYIKLLEFKVAELKESGDFSGHSTMKISKNDSPVIWLKTEKLFISVVSKASVEPQNLIESLKLAIENWNPTCHRLLLSKIKSELDDNGQSFENEVLNCRYTNVGWLEQFYNNNDDGTHVTVSRLMEGLTSSLKHNEDLSKYASELKKYIQIETLETVVTKESNQSIVFQADKEKIRSNLNAYICSQSPTGNHLAPGHIIEWRERDITYYFICLTPACDLVPRESKGWKENLGNVFPVNLVKLELHTDLYTNRKDKQKLAKDIVSGNHLFIKIDSEVKGFSFSKDLKSSPHWEQCYAENQGKFSISNGHLTLSLARTRYNPASLCIESRFISCRVVGQLRYEYALNLVNKLGTTLTRVGLDFVPLN
jgi:CheY-like chemotaxis protein